MRYCVDIADTFDGLRTPDDLQIKRYAYEESLRIEPDIPYLHSTTLTKQESDAKPVERIVDNRPISGECTRHTLPPAPYVACQAFYGALGEQTCRQFCWKRGMTDVVEMIRMGWYGSRATEALYGSYCSEESPIGSSPASGSRTVAGHHEVYKAIPGSTNDPGINVPVPTDFFIALDEEIFCIAFGSASSTHVVVPPPSLQGLDFSKSTTRQWLRERHKILNVVVWELGRKRALEGEWPDSDLDRGHAAGFYAERYGIVEYPTIFVDPKTLQSPPSDKVYETYSADFGQKVCVAYDRKVELADLAEAIRVERYGAETAEALKGLDTPEEVLREYLTRNEADLRAAIADDEDEECYVAKRLCRTSSARL